MQIIQRASGVDVGVDVVAAHFAEHEIPEADGCDPAFLHILEPLLIIVVFGAVEVEHILADQDKMLDAFLHQRIDDIAFELHDVVVERIVPLPHKLDHGKTQVVVGIQDLQKQRFGVDVVPLRVYVVAVDGMGVLQQAVLGAIQRRAWVFGS